MLQENARPLQLQYALPSTVPELKHINITVQPQTIQQLTDAYVLFTRGCVFFFPDKHL